MTDALKRQFQFESPDRMLMVDHPLNMLIFFPNEQAHFTTKNVVDLTMTKNVTNPELQGTIVLTNLRLIFMLDSQKTINTTIGYESIRTINIGGIQNAKGFNPSISKISNLNTLVLTCQHQNENYRFEYLPRGSKSIFDVLEQLYRAYDTARIYRQLRIREIIDPNRVFMDEEVCSTTFRNTVVLSSLSPVSVQGTLYLTSFRLFWSAQGQPHLNVSMPYTIVQGLQVKAQRFGKTEPEEDAVLIEGESGAKSLVMACKVVGVSVESVYSQLLDFCERAQRDPNYGIKIDQKRGEDVIELGFEKQFEEEQDHTSKISQIVKSVDRIAEYFESREQNTEIELNEEFGLAFEKRDDLSLDQIWNL